MIADILQTLPQLLNPRKLPHSSLWAPSGKTISPATPTHSVPSQNSPVLNTSPKLCHCPANVLAGFLDIFMFCLVAIFLSFIA